MTHVRLVAVSLALSLGCVVDVELRGKACSDAHACRDEDRCVAGACVAADTLPTCTARDDCDDAEACIGARCVPDAAATDGDGGAFIDGGTSVDGGASPDAGTIVDAGVVPWAFATWTRRARIDLDNAGRGEVLVDLPVLVVLDHATFDLGPSRPDGKDLRFADVDGVTELSYDVDLWDPNSITRLWVRVPSIAASSTPSIWLYFGNASNDAPDPTGAWSADFRGVWHFQGNMQDATAGNLDGVAVSATPASTIDGRISGALVFDGTTCGSLGDPADGRLDFGLGDFTIDVWARLDALPLDTMPSNATSSLWFKGGTSDGAPGETISLTRTSAVAKLSDDAPDAGPIAYAEYGDPAGLLAQFHQFAVVVDRTSQTMTSYLDGLATDEADISALGTVSSTFLARFGCAWTLDYPFVGALDELRVAGVARSPAWIDAAYASATGALADVGAIQTQ